MRLAFLVSCALGNLFEVTAFQAFGMALGCTEREITNVCIARRCHMLCGSALLIYRKKMTYRLATTLPCMAIKVKLDAFCQVAGWLLNKRRPVAERSPERRKRYQQMKNWAQSRQF